MPHPQNSHRVINPHYEHRQLIMMVTRACQLDCMVARGLVPGPGVALSPAPKEPVPQVQR